MNSPRKLVEFHRQCEIKGVQCEITGRYRDGNGTPLVFLHGFGSTHEDYADVIQIAQLDDRPVLAYDAPGFGRSRCSNPEALSIDFLVDSALGIIDDYQVDQLHLVGHSMGGLTALLLAEQLSERVVSFCNIEGNVAPEDCFLSRQVVDYSCTNISDFFDLFISRAATSRYYSSTLYASTLRHKVNQSSIEPIFRSMVRLSDHGGLLDRFIALNAETMFMFGEQNKALTYLPALANGGVRLSEINRSGHFPMYSNPTAMWDSIVTFILSVEALHP